jgi:hypothetical protein
MSCNSSLLPIRDGVLAWLDSVRWGREGWGRWKYNRHMLRDYGIVPSRIAISIFKRLGALGDVPGTQRREAVEYFQSCQDPADGFFKDPLVTEADRVPDAIHSWRDAWFQMNATGALAALDARPLYPSRIERFNTLTGADMARWTLELDWSDPWLAGERWASEVPAAANEATGAFRVMEDEILDPATGLPTRRSCENSSVALGGLFKIMHAYEAAERSLPHGRQIVDSVLGMQRDTGEFGCGRDMCINWDAVRVLWHVDRELDGSYRRADIAAAGACLSNCLMLSYRRPDGAFAFHGDHCLTVHHSIRVSKPLPESDMLGTSMCVSCLEYAAEWKSAL